MYKCYLKNKQLSQFISLELGIAKKMALLLPLFFLFSSASAGYSRSYVMGFTPWPWANTTDALETTYDFINNNSDVISHHIEEGVPWTEALNGKPFHKNMIDSWAVRKKLTGSNLKVFLSISPINQLRKGLADYRGAQYQMLLPWDFEGKSFNDPEVKSAYTNYASRAIDYFKPDYLAIAIEVNELLNNNPEQWEAFTELYKHTYKALKKLHPDLPIFFTSSLHNIVNEKHGEAKKTWKELGELWDFSDIAAISFYPFLQYPFDLSQPLKALDEVKKHSNKPVAISEMGYPAKEIYIEVLKSVPATPDIQKNMYYALLNKANNNNYSFVIFWAYRDYDILWDSMKEQLPEWGAIWRDVGLQDGQGNDRPSKQIWDLFFILPKR